MYRKVLTFINEAGDKQRVYIRNGECKNPAVMEKVLADGSGYAWEGIKTSGDTAPAPIMKHRRPVKLGNVQVPAEFLGEQNPPKAQPKPVELDAEGKAVPRKRGGRKASITPETLETIKTAAAEGKTLKEAEKALGIPYATLFQTAKKNGITFTKGKPGRRKVEAEPEGNTEPENALERNPHEGETEAEPLDNAAPAVVE